MELGKVPLECFLGKWGVELISVNQISGASGTSGAATSGVKNARGVSVHGHQEHLLQHDHQSLAAALVSLTACQSESQFVGCPGEMCRLRGHFPGQQSPFVGGLNGTHLPSGA